MLHKKSIRIISPHSQGPYSGPVGRLAFDRVLGELLHKEKLMEDPEYLSQSGVFMVQNFFFEDPDEEAIVAGKDVVEKIMQKAGKRANTRGMNR